MGEQRATCPHCGKLTLKMFRTDVERNREQIYCVDCGKKFFVVYGSGDVKVERPLR